MPISKTKNENFFKKWSSEMAYILGFFVADGSMTKNKRGAHFIELQITDEDLLYKIRQLLGSNHKITEIKRNFRWKNIYRLQIGSKEIFKDLLRLGLNFRKSNRIKLPNVPTKYFSDFTRGYFDGDGNVTISRYKRRSRSDKLTTILQSGFVSVSKKFLEELRKRLHASGVINGGTLYCSNGAWRLFFSINDSKRLYRFMYGGMNNYGLFLDRKKMIFEKYMGA